MRTERLVIDDIVVIAIRRMARREGREERQQRAAE